MPVSGFNPEELQKNTYKLYYKSYSMYDQKCQSAYTTYEVEDLGNHIGNISSMYTWILVISIILFLLCFLSRLFNLSDSVALISGIFTVLEIIGYLTLQVLYYFLKGSIAKINMDLLNYVIEN